jgi:hypothetical protein
MSAPLYSLFIRVLRPLSLKRAASRRSRWEAWPPLL